MDMFYIRFTLLLLTLLSNGNGYTFKRSSKTFFAISNSDLSMEELQQRGNRLFLENNEKLRVVCRLVDMKNWSLSRSEQLTARYALTGLQPHITFKNKTWRKTYKFSSQEVVSAARWRLEISRGEFSQGIDDILFEPWFVTVELGYGLGLFETEGILIQKEPLLNLSQNLGHVVDASFMVKSSENFVAKQAPCCSDIIFILPFKNQTASSVGGCYIGLTFGAFVQETILWLDLCQENGNLSLCHIFSDKNCDELRMLDFIVTRSYFILATSFGLLRSSNFKLMVSNKHLDGENFKLISSDTPFDDAFSSGAIMDDIRLQYTSYCLDFHVFDEKKELFYILYGKSRKTVYTSGSPFTQLQEMSITNTPVSSPQLLGIVNDLTRNTHVLLMLTSLDKYMVLVVAQEATTYVMFSPWFFPGDESATDLLCHTSTNTLFVYGSQVWLSRDGGNSFHQLTEITPNHMITSLSFPQYGKSVAAMTNHGTVFNGRIEISRLVAIHHQLFSGSLHSLLVDELQNIRGFFQNESNSMTMFGDYFVDTIYLESYQEQFCSEYLLLQYVGHEEVLLFVAAPYNNKNLSARWSYCLGSYTVGQVFRSRSGGSAHITEITHLNSSSGYFSKARCKVLEHFTRVLPSSALVLESSLEARLVTSKSNMAMYELIVPVNGTGWSIKDQGKTVVLSCGMSILLTKYANKSTMYGLAPPGTSHGLFPQGTQNKSTWQLYDFRSATAVLQRNEALSVGLSSEGFEASGTFDFNTTHVGMVLMISHDNHGVIQEVNGLGRVSFINNSMLKEGKFFEWSLYETPLDETELTPKDFPTNSGYGMWWLEEESCANFPIVTPKQYKTLYHLDSRDNLSLVFSVLAKHLDNNDPQIVMHVGNPSLFTIKNAHHNSDTNHTLKVDLERKPGTSGLGQVSFSVPYSSLKCPSVSDTLTIHGGCPPSKRLVFEYPYIFPRDIFLHGSPIDDKGILRSYKLPANYRPPSSRGIGIPMSSNLYNVFPEKPPYKERFAITRQTRLYKQCKGKSYRKDCQCNDDKLTMSSLVVHSDCINTVYRLAFQETFKPKFTIVEDDASTKRFQDPYYLVELNQRSDYQLLRTTDVSVSPDTYKTVLQDSLNSSLEFSGSGLYHFRAYGLQEGYTLCELSGEFIVFIDEMPLPHPARDIVRFTTAMVFASVSFLAYLWYFYLSRKGELNRVFRDT